MLSTLDIELNTEEKINYNIGSLLHGLLMQKIDTNYVDFLHNNSLNPYSQYILKTDRPNCYIWRISTLNQLAYENIIQPLLSDSSKSYVLNNRNIELKIAKKTIMPNTSYEELANKCFENETRKKITLKFITPTTIKTNGDYQIFPSLAAFYPSLLNKWNNFCTDISLSDEETKQHLINYSKIVNYNLKSTRFYMENIKINSFIGKIDIRFNGPQTLVNISNLLFEYAKYTGIGAKTSLGMGGVTNG